MVENMNQGKDKTLISRIEAYLNGEPITPLRVSKENAYDISSDETRVVHELLRPGYEEQILNAVRRRINSDANFFEAGLRARRLRSHQQKQNNLRNSILAERLQKLRRHKRINLRVSSPPRSVVPGQIISRKNPKPERGVGVTIGVFSTEQPNNSITGKGNIKQRGLRHSSVPSSQRKTKYA